MKNKLDNSAKLLIASDLIYSLTAVFLETFLVAYFLKITDKNISTIAIYYIIIYFVQTTGSVLMGRIIKMMPYKCKNIMSFGIITRALFILFIVILSSRIASNYILIAIIYSISEILYWCAHELIYIDVTTNDNRKKYMSIKKIFSKVVNIVSPIILGTSIEFYSFTKIAIYVFILSVIQIIITLFIRTHSLDKKKDKYSFLNFIKYIKNNNLKKLRYYNLSGVAYGIVESSISTLIIILTIMTFKTSLNLGVLTTIFAIFSVISLTIYNKVYNKNNAKKILFICSFVVLFGVIGLIINISKLSLIIYNFCYMITFCIFDVVYNTRKGDIVKECNIENYKEEYIGYTSIGIGLGRIIGYVLMLLVSFTANMIFLKILLLVVTLFAPVYCFYIFKSLKD